MTTLDVDLVRTFVQVADTQSFTAAGAALGATQSAVSVRLKKLEDRLGRRLLERTPRSVALTAFGESFLGDARRLLTTHDEAVRRALDDAEPATLTLGVSEHAVGAALPAVLSRLRSSLPTLRLNVTVGLSDRLKQDFDASAFDIAILRRALGRRDGQLLFRDPLCWIAAPNFAWRPDEPLPLVCLAAPCSLRAMALRALDDASVPWTEVFSGGGVAAVQAAVEAGLGIACLGCRNKPAGAVTLGPDRGLPPLPTNEVVLFSRVSDPQLTRATATIADAFKAANA